MDDVEARAVLGVGEEARWEDVRAAYRRLLRATHPDVAGGDDAGARTARLVEAYAVLRRHERAPGAPPSGPPPAPAVAVALVDAGTFRVGAPREEAFHLVMEAAQSLGAVAYVDRGAGLLELVVEFAHGPVCSVLVSLQGRAVGTDAFVTVEALSGGEAPPTAAVTALLAGRTGAAGR